MENSDKKNSKKTHLDKKREEKLRANLKRRKVQDKERSSILKDKEKE